MQNPQIQKQSKARTGDRKKSAPRHIIIKLLNTKCKRKGKNLRRGREKWYLSHRGKENADDSIFLTGSHGGQEEGALYFSGAERELSTVGPLLGKIPSGGKGGIKTFSDESNCICHQQTYLKRMAKGDPKQDGDNKRRNHGL